MDGIDGEMIEIVLFEVMSMHLNEQCCCWNGPTNEKRSYMASHVIKTLLLENDTTAMSVEA